MGTIRRRARNQNSGRITPEVVAAYHAGDRGLVHSLLRLPPWQANPIDASGECPWPPGTGGAATWADSQALREAIEAL